MTKAHAPGVKRTSARDAESAEDVPVAAIGRAARAWLRLAAAATAAGARAKRTLLAAATAAIDSGVASLQALRVRTDQTEPPDARRGERGADARRGPSASRARAAGAADATATVAPRPRRRARALLVYLGVMLAGGMLGTAWSYELLARLLEKRADEIARQEAKLSKLSKSVAVLKQGLERAQAKRIEAETRLAGAVAQSEAKRDALQKQQAELEQRLAGAFAAGPGDSRGRQGARGFRSAGECTLSGGDVGAVLKGCLDEMNRR